MLEDMDHMEASCILSIKIGMPIRLEPSKICIVTVTTWGIAMRTVEHYVMFSIWFISDPLGVLTQTPLDVISVEERTFENLQNEMLVVNHLYCCL